MFTGIVEATGIVRALVTSERSARLTIEAGALLDETRVGDSIAVNGVCLTEARVDERVFEVDVSIETLARTTLGQLACGTVVNLERPLAVGDRLSGHLVQGHVDGVGTIRHRRRDGDAWWMEIAVPPALLRYVVEKGSIAVDGVSLTVAAVAGDRVTVCLVPHTCAVTTLGTLESGRQVNLEVDIIAKYVERLVAGYAQRVPDAGASEPGADVPTGRERAGVVGARVERAGPRPGGAGTDA
jgi:riboflavin synthase